MAARKPIAVNLFLNWGEKSAGALLWQTLSVSEMVINAFQGWVYR